jgi:starch synthase
MPRTVGRSRDSGTPVPAAVEVPVLPLTVIHVAAEYWPVAQTGGLAEAVRGLVTYERLGGVRALAVVPLYRTVRDAGLDLTPFGEPLRFRLGPRDEQVQVWRWARPGAPDVLLVDHPPSFDRPGIYGQGGDYADNARRFALLSRSALALVPRLAAGPLVLHAHDWHAALAPVYLRTVFQGVEPYDRVPVVLSVHNAGYQGHFAPESVSDVGLPSEAYDWRRLEWYGRANWLKGGLSYADAVVTVSPTHAVELTTAVGGFGLHETFAGLGDRLVGILNGIDPAQWDPRRDPLIATAFSAEDPTGKGQCKAALQRELGLPVEPHTPLAVMSARLVGQKGFDLILAGLVERFPQMQFAFLGRGDASYEAALAALAQRHAPRTVLERRFTDAAEHRLLAGADILLAPSLYEPCGLTQMRAQRYGALPVARRVGGLADTIADGRTGFLFDENALEAFGSALSRAVAVYHDPAEWAERVRCAMGQDFGWSRSVARYLAVYRRTLAGLPGPRATLRRRRAAPLIRREGVTRVASVT